MQSPRDVRLESGLKMNEWQLLELIESMPIESFFISHQERHDPNLSSIHAFADQDREELELMGLTSYLRHCASAAAFQHIVCQAPGGSPNFVDIKPREEL